MAADGGEVIGGRYRLISRLGSGAMGVVWRAHDERLRRTVAIKQLRTPIGLSSTQIEQSHNRARREARIAARLQHPHAVALYDVFEHEGRPCLVMEYVPSRSLSQVLADGNVLTQAEVATIGAQLASALIAAHEAGIVHRDIKPGNILMSDNGTVKLTDFGISRATDDVTVTATGEMLGTPAFISPEVAQGRPAGAASDIFSLGATLYSAIEGTPPFGTGPTAMSLLLRIVNGEIRQPEQTGALIDTVMWMLHRDPTQRPSMDRVRRELKAVADALAAQEESADEASAEGSVAEAVTEVPTPVPASAPAAEAVAAAALPNPADEPGDESVDEASSEQAAEPVKPVVAAEPKSAKAKLAKPAKSAKPAKPVKPVQQLKPVQPAKPVQQARPVKPAALEPSPASTPVAPTTPPDSRPSTEPRPASRKRSRLLPVAFLAVAAVLTAAVVTAITAHNHSSHTSTGAAGKTGTPAATAQATPTASATRQATSTATTSATPTASPTTSASTSASITQQLSAAITHYYSLMPGNPDTAWGYMTTAYQTNTARGMTNYKAFWSKVQSVSLSNLQAQAPSTVVVTITYDFKDGTTERDRTRFGLVQQDGIWKIATSSVLSS